MSINYVICILTSSDINILELTIRSAIYQTYKLYDIYVIVNTLNKSYYKKVLYLCNTTFSGKIKQIIETESNGYPGMGHNSLLNVFSKTDYDYMVVCDGDDFLYPVALSRINTLLQKKTYDVINLLGNPSTLSISDNQYTQLVETGVKKYKWEQSITISKAVVQSISSDYNTTLATPCRLFVVSQNYVKDNVDMFDTRMKVYDDYKPFLQTYDDYIHDKHSICFLSDSYMYIYNKTSLTSVCKNNDYTNDALIYKTYDVSELDVSKINVVTQSIISKDELETVTKYDELLNKQYMNYYQLKQKRNTIVFVDKGIDWNYNTINERSLRGTENAIYQLANQLSNRNDVVILTKGGLYHKSHNVIYDTIDNINVYSNKDIYIHQGVPNNNILFMITNKKHILYIQHDINVYCIKQIYTKLNLFDKHIYKYIFVSHWQKQRYIETYNLPKDKCYVIQNAISPILNDTLHNKYEKKNELVYVSSPYRGLVTIVPLFKKILEHIPDLHIKIFSSYNIENTNKNYEPYTKDSFNLLKLNDHDKYYSSLYDQLLTTNQIEYYGNVPQTILFDHMKTSKVLFYPNTFEETCCTSLLEAMASRCFIVSSDIGALKETSNDMAFLYDPKIDINYDIDTYIINPIRYNQLDDDYVTNIVNKTVELINNYDRDSYQQQIEKQIDYIQNNCLWIHKANSINDLFI
tara:strand:- start:3445 stop:5517 length:2073 start_codon:yes stop_codon:yes gene_type:complete